MRVPPFANHLPVRIRFGEGVAGELAEAVAATGAQRALVVLDAGLEERSAAVAAALATLAEAGVDAPRFVKPPGEPTDAMADALAAAIAEERADALVAIGGGAVIDTAKAGRACAQLGCTFAELRAAVGSLQPPELPLIALPTTAGTGSEVSGGAVVTDTASGRKAGIAHPELRPQHALVDPVLTHSVPPALTAYAGVDALAQAIAGMVARARTPIGDALALEAVRLIGRSLVAAWRDGADADARADVACGSLLAGLTMNVSDCAAEHSLAQAIGGRFDAPHGLTVGVVFAETLERERRHVPAQLERVADALGVPDDGTRDGSRAVRGVRELLAQLDFPVLGSLGVREQDLDELADLALEDFFMTQSPQPWSRAEARAALAAALSTTERAAAAPAPA